MITKTELHNQANNVLILLNDIESTMLQEQIGDILEYVSTINLYNTNDETELNFLIDDSNRLREDELKVSVNIKDALKNAPTKNEVFFKVPKIIE